MWTAGSHPFGRGWLFLFKKPVQAENEDSGFGAAYQVDIREKAQRSMTV
ncbi:hypothetical protein [Selenomonas ruminantium]|nr:hypothetical protein [Selenomonas ruminantium]